MRRQLKKDLATITEVPCYYLHKNDNLKANTYVEYEVISERPSDHCGDRTLAVQYLIQVDVFSKFESGMDLMDLIKEKLEKLNYKFSSSFDDFETQTGLYHYAMRFYYKKFN